MTDARPAARPQPGRRRAAPGLLDVVLPWVTLAGLSDVPGVLGRIGPVTAAQARQLPQAAGHDPAAQWRVIVTNSGGQAIAVTRIRRRTRDGPSQDSRSCRDSPSGVWPPRAELSRAGPGGCGLVGRVTLVISQDTCACNLGGACRSDHQLKQHPSWKLEQTRPGQFTWTTPPAAPTPPARTPTPCTGGVP